MLEYENQMLLEILEEDGLVVAAKGLGMENVFVHVLKIYSDPGNLIIVLGTTDHDERYFMEKLKALGVKHLPRVITAQCTSSEREVTYLEGGVLFISGRIFVVDLLKERVPLNLITGILVYRAHTILNSYQETFALRLYRKSNKTGFVKAFSNSALAFTSGFAQVERVMKVLFVKRLYLWPRFHTIVNNSLSKRKPQVVELHVKITSKMLSIQTALLDIMNYMIKDMKRINKYLDLDELTVENAISRKFHKQLQLELDPVWHQLSDTSKQLLADLKTLRSFLTCLTHEDSVTFYATLNRLRTMEYAMKTSGWLMLDPVENLFKCAKARVYSDHNELKPESNPKWDALTEVLMEIQTEQVEDEKNARKVLLLVHDSNTCKQLRNYLIMGANEYLLSEAFKKLEAEKAKKKSPDLSPTAASKGADKAEEVNDSYTLMLSQRSTAADRVIAAKQDSQHLTFEECSQIADLDLSAPLLGAPLVIIQSLKKDGDPMALSRTLAEHLPEYVVLYVTDISAVRQLEVYQSNNPSINLKVYFLIYRGSVEEQEYLTSLRREKEAFHRLITTKTTMVVPEDQDGKSDDCLTFATNQGDPIGVENTRKCGGQASHDEAKNRVIVDMREFRSELPALLHKRGIEIEPITLAVGDYILTSEICIERKSISDLIGSLNSGRLYNQAVAMTRHYPKPMLLIEFDQNKPFCLQGNYYISKDIKSIDVTAKLQLLTLHFPKLKLVWSPNPHATAQLFEELKVMKSVFLKLLAKVQGGDQPCAAKAAQIGLDEDTEDKMGNEEKYNARTQDFIAKLPGVHTKNLRTILNKGRSLDHLVKLTTEELSHMLGNGADARTLHNALHEKCCRADRTPGNSAIRHVPRGRGKVLFSKINKK